MINFKGKKILITGATGGIGYALVKKFVSLEGNILATGTKIEKLDVLKKEFPKINILKFDISNHSKIGEFIENVSSQLTGLDILINNAGINMDNLSLRMKDEEWKKGERYVGVWWESEEDTRKHQEEMTVVPSGKYKAMAVAPLSSGKLDPPDICLIYATPAQMILFINGLQWAGYKKLDFSVVGESSCADSWGRALSTGEPSLSLPCFAERRYGGVMEDELLMAIPPAYLPKVIEGLAKLSANGLRYPIPPYGIQNDARAGLGHSYGK